jgi:PAS domain S-box-containing protein
MEGDAEQLAGWILGSLSSGIVAVDADGAIVALNPEARRILGCPEERASPHGVHCRRVLEAQPTVARLLIETLHGRDTLSRAELVLEPTDGQGADIIGFTLSPIRNDDGRIRGAFMLFRNLTPIERSDEQDRLRERLAALGQMAAGMAHEIRNPLAGMEVIAGLLKRRLGDRPEEQLLVEELTGELHQLADTVTASLEFVKPVSIESGPVDPVSLIEESLTIARSRVAFSGAIERCYDGRLPELWVDADQLRGVLTNLVVNAFEAMAEDTLGRSPKLVLGLQSHVADRVGRRVRVSRDGRTPDLESGPSREVVISVSDSGPGVPHDLREKVFYPFFTTRDAGSGVGLAAAQKIVASHGGVIELDDAPEGGSSFRVRLPDRGADA